MSLDQFKNMSEQESITADTKDSDLDDSSSWDCNWHIKLEGYWEEVDERFFDEDAPNEPPLMAVPEKMAAELHLIDDKEVVQEVSEWWDSDRADQYNEVIKVVFNDLSTWHIPVRPWDEDYACIRDDIVECYLPEVVRWEAILEGKDPDEAVENWDKPWEKSDPQWFEDVSDTGMSDSTRKWINENVSAIPHIDRKVKSDGDEVELDVEDDDWEDDW